MPQVARRGDTSNHGGVIITSCSRTPIEGPLAARKGDLHACPIHGVTPIVSNTSPNTYVEGKQLAMVGSVCGCGAVIVTGASKTYVN